MIIITGHHAGAQDLPWPGWRGVAREGRSDSSQGPLHWAPNRNIVWRTGTPGWGHSSPIVTRDAVYLTEAEVIHGIEDWVIPFRYLLTFGALLLLFLAFRFLIQRVAMVDASPGRRRRLLRLTLYVLLIGGFSALVLLAESGFYFARSPERTWTGAVVVSALALLLSSVYVPARSRAKLIATVTLFLLAVLAFLTVPDVHHAFDGGIGTPKAVFICLVIALPALTGLAVLASHLTGSVYPKSLGMVLRGVAILGAIAVPVITIWLISAEQEILRTESSAWKYYHPRIPLVTFAGAAILFGIFAVFRRSPRMVRIIRLGFISSAALLVLVAILIAGEWTVSKSLYLSYALGIPRFFPLLEWPITVVFIIACAFGLVAVLVIERRRQASPVPSLPRLYRAVAYSLAVLFFIYAVFIPKGPQYLRSIVSYDRETGKQRWVVSGLLGPRGMLHGDNSPATPTPVTDGRLIFGYFGNAGVLCVDTVGKERWTNRQLPFSTRWGAASCPILVDGKLIILSESDEGRYLVALDTETGKQLWRTDRHKKIHESAGNCRTPALYTIGDRKTIIVWGFEDLSGYDPTTGRELWTHEVGDFGRGTNPVNSMVSDGRILYLTGPQQVMALVLDRLPEKALPVLWQHQTRFGAQCSSPVLANGLLFHISDIGTIHCLDAHTGAEYWSERLRRQHYASLVAIGNRIYAANTSGRTTVFAADRSFRMLAVNQVPDRIFASFAPVDGSLFVRTTSQLLCIREDRQEE